MNEMPGQPVIHPSESLPRNSGMVLWVVTLILAALAIVGTTIFSATRIDTSMSGHHKKGLSAFYNADAGVRHVVTQVRSDVEGGSLVLGAPTVAVSYTPPAGFNYDPITQLTQMPDGEQYLFTVVGHALDARAEIEAVLSGDDDLTIGFFGDERISMGPGAELRSYDSNITQNPGPADSTDETTAGTNEEMGGGPGAVHGSVTLGKDTLGNQATYVNAAPPTEVILSGRIDPDPLGAVGGALADDFTDIQTVNDNASAVGAITQPDGSLLINADTTLVAGEYWVSELDIGNHERLTVDATAGEVIIYLTGPGFISSQGEMVVNPNIPDNLHLFSNSTDGILFKPGTDFTGSIYAPYAAVDLQPNGKYLGSAWAWQLNLLPGNGLYYDTSSTYGKKVPGTMRVATWKQVM